MKSKIGLYYPFIHFKNEDWLKASALYWDKMGRIVPYGYEIRNDTETVKRLAGNWISFVISILENGAVHFAKSSPKS